MGAEVADWILNYSSHRDTFWAIPLGTKGPVRKLQERRIGGCKLPKINAYRLVKTIFISLYLLMSLVEWSYQNGDSPVSYETHAFGFVYGFLLAFLVKLAFF